MSVKVNEYTMVYPSDQTPHRSLWLSKLDMMIRQPYSHTHVLFIYHLKNTKITSSSHQTNNINSLPFFYVETLKEALSRALVPFYPLAGRLKVNENGRFEIDCNENGALFVDAETINTIGDLGDEFAPNYKLRKELIPDCDYSKGISSFPLLIVQVTRFSCGGVTLGVATNHHVADGTSHMQFINYWASLARGYELISVIPCHDRAHFLGPRDPPQVKFKHMEYELPLPPVLPKHFLGEAPTTIEHLFKLSEEQVNALKQEAVSREAEVSNKSSTFKVIAAHVWRSVCKARGLAYDQDVKLYIHTNGRSRLKDPSLPQGYFGNVIFFSCCVARAGDVVHNPLWYTINIIDEAVKKMNNSEYLRSVVDYLESQQDLTAIVRGAHTVTCPNLQINSWARLPISETDFGWGGPISIGLGEIKSEGQSKIISSLTGDKSMYVGIRLFASHMDLFHKCFYDLLKR